MKKSKRGFTLIEVSLFLAITVALFVGIAAGVQGMIFQQRYNDAVQSYAEFLRSIYSQVANVQNEWTGRSDKAIYGKVLTFRAAGEKPKGKAQNGLEQNGAIFWQGNVIKTYNLIGDVESIQENGEVGTGLEVSEGEATTICSNNMSVIDRLTCLHASIFIEEEIEGGTEKSYRPVGFVESYNSKWTEEIQRTDGWIGDKKDGGYRVYEGIVIITHSPTSGNISTYVWDGGDDEDTYESNVAEIRKVIGAIEQCESGGECNGDPFGTLEQTIEEGGTNYLKSDRFRAKDIDFCINPHGYEFSNVRRNIRLARGAHNASGVDVLDEDRVSEDEPTAETDKDKEHNRCRY